MKTKLLVILFCLLIGRVIWGQDTGVVITIDNAEQLQESLILEGHEGRVNSIDFNPQSNILASAGDDQTVRIWDTNTGEVIHILEGHTDDIEVVTFSPDGSLIVSGGKDDVIRLWSVETGEELAILEGHTDRITGLAFNPVTLNLVSSSWDGTVRVWDLFQRAEVNSFDLFITIWDVDVNSLGTQIVVGIFNSAQILDFETGEVLATLEGHENDVRAVHFNVDGTLVGTGSEVGVFIAYDVETRMEIIAYDETNTVDGVAFSPNNELVVIANGSRAQLFNVLDGNLLSEPRVSDGAIRSVDFNFDGTLLAGSSGNVIYVWSIPDATTSTNDETQDGTIDVTDLCTPLGLEFITNSLIDAADAISEGQEPDNLLLNLQVIIATYRSQCSGLIFTSEEYDLNAVTDAIVFPDGVYTRILESTDNFRVDITVLQGRCGATFRFIPSEGGISEDVVTLEDCIAVIDFDGDAPWTLTFEPILVP